MTDHELVVRLRRLVRADQALGARLLVHIGEVDARCLYRDYAYASMFTYCVEELHMSEAEAYLRIHAARLVPAPTRSDRTACVADQVMI
jgi:hypothetical protein